MPPEVQPGAAMCECAACGHLFNSPSAFDRHQVGVEPVRCYPPTAKGMVILRQASDDRPIWGLKRRDVS